MRKSIIIYLLSIVLVTGLTAQVITNEYIVTVDKAQLDALHSYLTIDSRYSNATRILSRDLGILLVKSELERDLELEQYFNTSKAIKSWAYNHKTEKRLSPDDQYFDMQWGLSLIEAPQAWEVTTGGLDFYDNEIVVAVLDESFDIDHPELVGQIYVNNQEILGDGIDNDDNGYIDDYQGWDTRSQTGILETNTDNHGTAVSGIIGANGDNSEGIAGINWNVKILPITGINTQAEVIAGYQYIVDMRRLYNETDGERGAYIVATNYSAGINAKFGTDPAFKSWCDMYDAMGEVGVISCGATTNKNFDVDEGGDIPTTCQSEYLIAVTNVDESDSKVSSAGFGAENIDLGAPGRGTITLDINGGYDQNFGGTSAAAPHVAGTIALLYSLPCKAIADLAKTAPNLAAREIITAVLRGVDDNTTLDGITKTGGRLNIFNAMEEIQSICTELELTSPKGALEISKVEYNVDELTIRYLTPDEQIYNLLITDLSGKTVYHELFTPPSVGRKVFFARVSDAPRGIYFISIYNDESISTKKLFIE